MIAMFHAAIGDRNYIQLRPGPAILAPLTQFLDLPPHVETNLTVDSLIPAGAGIHDIRPAMREKNISGMWLGTSRSRLRRWGEQALDDWMSSDERTASLIQLGFPDAYLELKSDKIGRFNAKSSSNVLEVASWAILLSGPEKLAPVVTDFLRLFDIKQPCNTSTVSRENLHKVRKLLETYDRNDVNALLDLIFASDLSKSPLPSFGFLQSMLAYIQITEILKSKWKDDGSDLLQLPGFKRAGSSQEMFVIGPRHIKLAVRALTRQRALNGSPSLEASERSWLVGQLPSDKSSIGRCKAASLVALAGFQLPGDQEMLHEWVQKINDLSVDVNDRRIIYSIIPDLIEIENFSDAALNKLFLWNGLEPEVDKNKLIDATDLNSLNYIVEIILRFQRLTPEIEGYYIKKTQLMH